MIHRRSVMATLAALAVAGLLVGGAVVGFGLYNVSARLGHLPGIGWMLHTTFRNSVDLHADESITVPNLRDPELIALGARHFDAACRDCHGAPGVTGTATYRAMLPHPPHIQSVADRWAAHELHWIVYEGIKMSGMPQWTATRPDEVWPVVAFLSVVSDMQPGTYRQLTAHPEEIGETSAPDALGYCARCHGADGVSGNAHIPRLDILSETYVVTALRAYRAGARQSGIMEQAASTLSDDVLSDLASRFARMEPDGSSAVVQSPDADIEAGRDLAFSDAGDTDVPACAACHGPWPEPLDDRFPALAGQYPQYLEAQLKLWREGARGGGVAADLMHLSAKELTDRQIRDVAAFYASLPAAKLNDTLLANGR